MCLVSTQSKSNGNSIYYDEKMQLAFSSILWEFVSGLAGGACNIHTLPIDIQIRDNVFRGRIDINK